MANPAIDHNADAVLADFMRRTDAGETIDREAFVAAHPTVAEDLREYFASVDDVERMAGPPLASTAKNGVKAVETHVSSVGDSVSEKPARQTLSANKENPDSLPETFGRYRIENQLGRGAMGAVYLAHDTQLDRRVALKTPTFDTNADADMVERFYREARAAANLRHAGICPIFDVGKIDETHYISMAYIEGKPMSALVDVNKPLPIRSVVSLVRKIALALDHAHNQGVIHRDLKPANIMIDKQKQPLIMDFGLARRVDKHEQTRLTQDGMILGTPAYMSPEQVEGNLESGKQSDVYSLGVILYELLTGDLPFQGTIAAVIGQIMTQDAPPPSGERSEIDPALDAICQKMMARKIEDRYAGTKEAAVALTDYLKGKASGRRQPADLAPEADACGSRMTVTADEGLAAFLETASNEEFPAVKTRRDGTLTQIVAPWKKLPPRTKVIATSALSGLLLLLGVIIMIRTPNGTVRVEVVGNEDVEITIDGGEVKLTDQEWKAGEHRLALKLGGQQLAFDTDTNQFKFDEGVVEVTVGGVKLTSQKFEVVRGERTVLGIEVVRRTETPSGNAVDSPPSPSLPNAVRTPQLISQFDHKANRTKESYIAILSPDATRVAYRMEFDDPLQMFDTASKRQIVLPEELRNAHSMDYNADGSRFATGHADGTVRIWNAETLEPVGQPFVTTAGFWVYWVSLSDDGKTVLALPTGQPTNFYGWEVESRKPVTELLALNIDKRPKGIHVATSADNLLLAFAYYKKQDGLDHFVQLWDVRTGRPRDTQFVADQGSLGTIFDIDLSPRGDRLAVATQNNDCIVFDTATGKQTMTAKHGERVFSACFSSDGRQLATCGGPAESEDMHLWDVATGEKLARWKLPRDAESSKTDRFGAQTSHLVYSHDGSQLLTAGVNTPVCVWRLDQPQIPAGLKIESFEGHSYAIISENLDWQQSVQRCRKYGGQIVSTETRAELDFIKQMMRNGPIKFCRVGSKEEPGRGWRWLSGEPIDPKLWAPGEPNNLKVDEQFAIIDDRKGRARLMDATNLRCPCICEWTRPIVQAAPLAQAPFDGQQARIHQESWAKHLGVPVEKEVELPGGAKMSFMLIPPGEFMMGSSADDQVQFIQAATGRDQPWSVERIPSEGPQHRVRITKPFWMSRHEVTRREFRQFVTETGYKTDAERDGEGGYAYLKDSFVKNRRYIWSAEPGFPQSDDDPVVNVSWNDATAFCQWFSKKADGVSCGLPSESQWEYACRSGTSTSWYSGDDKSDLSKYAWSSINSGKKTQPVGRLQPNGFGLCDMHGNVWEWCHDWYAADYYQRSPANDPTGPATGSDRVMRGGSWDYLSRLCRSAYRHHRPADYRQCVLGFRVVCEVRESATASKRTPTPDTPSPLAPPIADTDWTDLFNGKDLTGWQQMRTSGRQDDVHRPTTGDWVVQNGQIVCNSSSSGWLKSAGQFDNFELELEFKLSQLGNSGVYIRSSGSGRLSRTGVEAQVIDDTAAKFKLTSKNRSGAIHNVIGPSKSALRPLGEWNTMSIRCEGDVIQVTLNGVVTAKRNMADDSALRGRPRSGYLGLANWHGEGIGTAFRNIRIRELEKTAATSGPSTPKTQNKIELQLKKLEQAIFPWLVWVQAKGDTRKPLAVATKSGLCCVYPGGFKNVDISSLNEKQKVAGTVGSRSPFPFCWIDPAMPKANGIALARAGAHRIAQPGVIVMRKDGKPELQIGQVNADGTFTPEQPYNPPTRGVTAPGPIFNANGECLGYGVRSKRGSPIKIYPLRRE